MALLTGLSNGPKPSPKHSGLPFKGVTKRYLVQVGEATLADLSYIQADIEDSSVVCTTRQAAIYGRVHDRYGAHAHERHHAISSYIRSVIRIERRGCFERKFLRRDLTTRWVNP